VGVFFEHSVELGNEKYCLKVSNKQC